MRVCSRSRCLQCWIGVLAACPCRSNGDQGVGADHQHVLRLLDSAHPADSVLSELRALEIVHNGEQLIVQLGGVLVVAPRSELAEVASARWLALSCVGETQNLRLSGASEATHCSTRFVPAPVMDWAAGCHCGITAGKAAGGAATAGGS